jgi:hypothetical protein
MGTTMQVEGVSIVFEAGGLGIYRLIDRGERTLIHRVAASTLQQMSMADLEYCLSTNTLTEMPSLRQLFADYLWADEGKTPPRLDKHAPR